MHATIIALLAATAGFTAATPITFANRLDCPIATGKSAYYVCASNGFRGYCSADPCAQSWCRDFKPQTCDFLTPASAIPPPAGSSPVSACPGTAPYYVCANNGFRGSCSVDPCALNWCPDYEAETCKKKIEPPTSPPTSGDFPKPSACHGSGAFYVCASNSFRGNCSIDPCSLSWCPDYKTETCKGVDSTSSNKSKPGSGKNKSY